jgi:hypothetical protein
MTEVTLLDALGPFINLFGGFAGLSILYFISVLWQNKKKLARLSAIEEGQRLARERDMRIMKTQRDIMTTLSRYKRVRK